MIKQAFHRQILVEIREAEYRSVAARDLPASGKRRRLATDVGGKLLNHAVFIHESPQSECLTIDEG
jgi:hypothetical protein